MTTGVDTKKAPPPPPPKPAPAKTEPSPGPAAKPAPASTPEQNPVHVVQRGDTLSGIATANDTKVDTIRKINPQIRDPDLIHPGDRVNLPRPSDIAPAPPVAPPAAKSPEVARVDAAVKENTRADEQLAQTRQESARGNQVLRAQLPAVQQSADQARASLKTAVADEIDKQVPPDASDAIVAKAGQDISARYVSDPGASKAVAGAVTDIRGDRQVQSIVANVRTQTNPTDALRTLNNGYVAATPNAHAKLQNDPVARQTIDAAAAWANQPLDDKSFAGVLPQGQTAGAIGRLDTLTKGLDKNLAAAVAEKTLPGYNKFVADNQDTFGGGSPFASLGTTSLMNVSARIAGTPAGDRTVAGFATMHGWNTDSVRNAIAGGADPAYAIEYGKQMKAAGSDPSIVTQTINDGMVARDQSNIAEGASPAATIDVARRMQAAGLDSSGVVKVATDGVQAFKDKTVDDVKKLADHDAQLSRLVQNDGAGMTPEQLNKAVADYRAKMGAGWQADEANLKQQIATDGSTLAKQMIALNQAPPSLSGSRAALDDTLKTIANDPAAGLAISTAIQTDPKLADIDHVSDMADVFALSKVGDVGRKFVNEAASAYVRQNVLTKMQGVDLNNPASVAAAKDAIGSLRDERFARVIGVSKSDLDKAVNAVQKAADEAGSTPAQANKALADLNKTLNTDAALSKTFNKTTLPGQLLRGVAVGFAGASLLNSASKAIANPADPQNDIKAALDAVGFAQKNSEILVGLGAVNKSSALGQFGGEWKLAGRATAGDLIAGVSAVLDGVSAVRSGFGIGTQQDTGNAIFSATTAVGGALTVAPAFGAAAFLGPVGLGVTAVGVLGKLGYDAIKDAHQDEGAAKDFLKSGGYTDAAASALSKQGEVLSGASGSAQMPFLMKYAQIKQMTPTQTQQWVNGLSADQVDDLSKRLLQTAGDSHGDPDQFVDGPAQTVYINGGGGFAVPLTSSNTVGVFEGYLNHDHVPHP